MGLMLAKTMEPMEDLSPPNDKNIKDGGGGTVTGTAGMPQAGYFSDGTRYSIPFYDILISIRLMAASVRRMFQKDNRSADNFANYINQEAFDQMLENDDYGLNTLSMVKQQRF